MLTSSIDADFTVRAIQARTDAAGDPVDDLSGEADRLIHGILTPGLVRPADGYRLVPAGGMNLELGSGAAKTDLYCVAGSVAGQMPYLVRLESATVAVAVPAADTTQQRTDEVWLVVHDAAYDAGAVSLPRLGYRTGTPGGGPPGPDPAWKAAAPLWRVTVPVLATDLVAGNLVDQRTRVAIAPEVGGVVPVGGIIEWGGSIASIPFGWRLCDGTGGTPDLRGRFVAGAGGEYAVGATGGANTVTLTTAQMPAHNHIHSHPTDAYGRSAGSAAEEHYHTSHFDDRLAFRQNNSFGGGNQTSQAVKANTGGSVGSGNSHENRPPYYALAYIQRVA